MTNFFNLTKIQLKQMVGAMFFKQKNKKIGTFIFLMCLFSAFIAYSLGTLYYQLGIGFKTYNMTYMLFFQAGIMSLLLVTLFITLEAQAYFFKTKDFEFLSGLPISNRQVVFAKLFAVLTSSYFYTIITFIPAIVVYFLLTPFSISTFLLCIVGILFFPFLPTALGMLLGLLFAWISSNMKKSNIVNFILTFIFFVAYLYFSTAYNDLIRKIVEQGETLLNAISIVLPTIGLFIKGMILKDISAIFLYIGVNIITLFMVTYFTALGYRSINLKLKKVPQAKEKGEIKYNQQNQMTVLLKNEAKRYFGTTVYFFNTFMIGFLAVIYPVLMYIIGFKSWGIDENTMYIVPQIMILIITLFITSCNTASVSISMEGTKFNTLKSYPIKTSKILASKIIFNLLITLPLCLIIDILMIVLYDKYLTFSTTLALILLPPLASITSALFGILANLWFPKMKYENYTQVVKQSASAVLGMLGSMFIASLPYAVFFIFFKADLDFIFILAIAGGYYILLTAIFSILLKVKGNYWFNQIEVS